MFRKKWFLPILMAVGVVSCCALIPSVQQVRNGEPRVYSMNSLKQIAYAFHSYHGVNKKLPPAAVLDKEGKALYSWRVLLLPFLEEGGLYNNFKLDEPWDSLHNKRFLEETPRCYLPFPLGGNDPAGTTRYQVFVGPGTAFEEPGFQLGKHFPDGLENTLLVAEGGDAVPWSKPVDLAYDPKGPLPKLGGQYTMAVRFLGYQERY